jgi:hypothetical protein
MLTPANMSRVLLALPVVMTFATAPGWVAEAGSDAAATSRVEPAKPHVDEIALRYYASLKQTARVEAETRRLRRLHPDWQPPADLWTYRAGRPDEARLWELFAADRLDELRAAMAARRVTDSAWMPSSDLEQKLRRKEQRIGIIASARERRWSDVAKAAGDWRADVAADDLETLWLIAEGLSRTARTAEATQVLDNVLVTSLGPSERIATMRKALGLLPLAEVERLLQRGRLEGGGRGEFDAIANDIVRARISAVLRDEASADVSAADMAGFEEFAKAAPNPNEAALLGWYALKRSDPHQALDQFKVAIAKGGDATVALGLALTLRQLGRLRDAEEVAYAWREPLPANMTLFIDVVAQELSQRAELDPKRLERYGDVTLLTASGEGAEALGWYAYNACQFEAASEWFRRAVAWLPRETAVFGYALSLQRLKRHRELVEIVNRYDGLFPTVVELVFPAAQRPADDSCRKVPGRADAFRGGMSAGSSPIERPAAPSLRLAETPRQAGWSAVPLPDRLDIAERGRKIPSGAEFPIVVDPENTYRAGRTGAKLPAGSWRAADPIAPVTEARRVPGVAAMPYERLGRNLASGWNGIQQPSATPGAMLRAPSGTPWASDQQALGKARPQAGAPATGAASGPADMTRIVAADRFHP